MTPDSLKQRSLVLVSATVLARPAIVVMVAAAAAVATVVHLHVMTTTTDVDHLVDTARLVKIIDAALHHHAVTTMTLATIATVHLDVAHRRWTITLLRLAVATLTTVTEVLHHRPVATPSQIRI